MAKVLKLAAVVLAAGQSRRFGGDKRFAQVRGRPLIAHALDALAGFDFAQKIAVVRPEDPIESLVRSHGVILVINPDADDGMGTSLACGIAALEGVDGAFIVLADMPDIPPALYVEMADRFAEGEADIVIPRHNGQAGHPVLFGATCFAELKGLHGDRGARALFASQRYVKAWIEVDSAGVLRDIDQQKDLIL